MEHPSFCMKMIVCRKPTKNGVLDGERFMFLQTNQGLIYSKDAYKSLLGALTLEDIKKYVVQMIGLSE